MRELSRSIGRLAGGGGLLLGLLVAAPDLRAQGVMQPGDPRYILADDPNTPDLDLQARARSGFQLFADADFAAVGMHTVGAFMTAINLWGPCANNQVIVSCMRLNRSSVGGAAVTFIGFDMSFVMAAPPYEWNKARALAPTLDSATGGGYTVLENFAHLPRLELGPDDGSLGRDFTGALTTAGDGSCNDNNAFQNGAMVAGIPLLPSPSCPATLVGGVFPGDHPIEEASWANLATAQGTAFRWDFWRVPNALKRLDKNLGNNFSTYGVMSDHYREQLARYGMIIPGGVGAPQQQGWPLGVKIVMNAYDFAAPAISSGYIMQVLLINESQKVYGVGISYDSLYFLLEHGMAFTGQANASYFEPQRSAFISTGNRVNTNCNGASNPVASPSHACIAALGFSTGAFAAIYLKSPIGDLRNKLFTRPSSVFFGRGNPQEYDDTIAANIGHMCGFGGCNANTHTVNERRSYGVFTSHPDDALDGRAPSAISTESEYWRTYRNRRWPVRDGIWNTMVPSTVAATGAWDWDDNGVADTLWYDTCGGPRNMSDLGLPPVGCVRTFADTLPGKQNNRYNNTGGAWGVGPFALASGDTTGFLIAFVGEPDSITIESTINSMIDAYLSFFLLAEAPPPVRIASSEITTNTLTNGRTVSMFYSDAPETWVDPFLTKVAADITAALPGTVKNFGGQLFDLDRIRRLNPGLVASITARAADNLAALEIYKSCDGGNTFTGDADCDGDPAVDNRGRPIGTGWAAYATITRALGGADIPNVFNDAAVTGGKTYLYTFVAKSRGASFPVLDSLPGLGFVGRVITITDSLQSPLSRSTSDPQVLSVYVPASREAGSTNASANLVTQAGGATVPSNILFSGRTVSGQYTATFGNKFIVQSWNQNAALLADSTIIFAQDTVRAVGGVTVVIAQDILRTTQRVGIPAAATVSSTVVSVIGGVTVTTREYRNALGFLLSGPRALPDTTRNPLFFSTNLVGDAATPSSIINRTDYPGFSVSANNTLAGTFQTESALDPNGVLLNQNNISNVTGQPQFRQETSVRNASGGGNYILTWNGDPWGLQRGLVLNFGAPAVTEAEINAALAARSGTGGTVGKTDAATATLTGLAAASLAAVRVPFTIVNSSYGNRPVSVAMRVRPNNTLLLGDGSDTIRVTVPTTEWMPGDSLILIETVQRDSVIGGLVVLSGLGQPVQTTRDTITFRSAIFGCNIPRERCNPVRERTPGATGFVPFAANTKTTWNYYVGFNRDSRYVFDVLGPRRGDSITTVTAAQLDSVRVVPNPYVVFSSYQPDMNTPRVLFSHLPPSGTLRIYSVSGQFLQRLNWTAANLNGAGDLYYDLTTREGTALASGLYIWVLTTTQSGSGTQTARGKFVVIRGRAQ